MLTSDTIAAIATPAGSGGVGVVRVSGADALLIAEQMTGKSLSPRYAHYSDFLDGQAQVVDQGIVLYFQAPHSYTGEDVVEFQGHGGVYVLQQVLQTILQHGARQARPGEFSERAFLNGKMDLLQAEAVADLIASRSQAASAAALRSLSGYFSALIADLQAAVIALRVYVEAALDFAEEEIDFLSEGKVAEQLATLLTQVENIIEKANYGKLLQDGVSVVLVGEPNVGKSSLMNRLLGHERAIVTEQAGTTRDTLQEVLNIDGIPVRLTDTAGLRKTQNVVEQAGIERTKTALADADLVLWLRDGNQLHDQAPEGLSAVNFIEVHNKADLFDHDNNNAPTAISISAKTGQGIAKLLAIIADKLSDKHHEEGVFAARERHVQALLQTQHHIAAANDCIKESATAELVAEELRLAQQSLSEITGEYHSDDLLGAIFSSFCVGK